MMSTKRWFCSDNHIVGYVGRWQQTMFQDHDKDSLPADVLWGSFVTHGELGQFFFFFTHRFSFCILFWPTVQRFFIKVAFCNQNLKKPKRLWATTWLEARLTITQGSFLMGIDPESALISHQFSTDLLIPYVPPSRILEWFPSPVKWRHLVH